MPQYSAIIIMWQNHGSQIAWAMLPDNGIRQGTIELDSMTVVDMSRSKNTSNLTLKPIVDDYVCPGGSHRGDHIVIGKPIRSQTI